MQSIHWIANLTVFIIQQAIFFMTQGRAWLAAAIANFTRADPVKQMLIAIEIVTAQGHSDAEVKQKEAALEALQDYCEDIDNAKGQRNTSYFFTGTCCWD